MRAKIARFSNSAWSDLHEEHTTGTSHLIPSVAHLAHEAGAALRKKLIGKYVLDEMPSRDLVEFSHYHTVSGGVGLEDLAMDPQKVKFKENFNKHVKLVLAKEFPSPSYYYAGIPMIEQLASRREMISQPFVPFSKTSVPITLKFHTTQPNAVPIPCMSRTLLCKGHC